MTEFLQDTSENVSKEIEGERKRQKVYAELTEKQRNLIVEGLQYVQAEAENERENPLVRELKLMKESMEYLKK